MNTRQRGFTLIELMIAMLIFSILSAMAYGGLHQVILAKGHTEKQADALVRLQTAFSFLERDMEQAYPRSHRDQFGEPQPAVQGGSFGSVLIELTRTGLRNPTGAKRSSLQRIAYRLEDEKLIRLTWPALDFAQDSEPFERVLLDDVTEITIRYLDKQGEWSDAWPASLNLNKPNLDELPLAVEVIIENKSMGPIRRLFHMVGTV